MADYRQIMLLLLQEHSYRQVAARVGCSQNTVARARRVLTKHDLTTISQVEALTGEDLERLFSEVKSRGDPSIDVKLVKAPAYLR